jgi:hypothetical protein
MVSIRRVITIFRRLVSITSETTSHRHGQLVLIDLPVDLVVVLEQQERASQAQCSEEALAESRCRR